MPKQPDDTRSKDSDFNALWSSDGVTRSFSPSTSSGLPADLPFLFNTGQQFGPYAIVRPLGKGGMGQVYEAEEADSGRRVALKLLSRGLGDDEERERFLREGRLAASLSHPHCVYVFGTSEIQGFPVIAMELVPEGTLKDRVKPEAPMTAAQAVDAILQVVAGLGAAASIGILHRDIKPSNCFVHRDGRILVGDFGLSVDAGGEGNAAGTILGTPGFASPEQLRGGTLDVRSDIYSVGATLFYLLAGRAPFDDRDTTSLLKRVASEPPPLLTSLRPDLPRGLAALVAKCLAKSPADRYASHAALRSALEPFGSAQLAPAPIVRRTIAGMIDLWVAGVCMLPFGMLLQLFPVFGTRGDSYLLAAINVLVTLLYFGLLEGRWGAAAGKALVGLRVVDAHHVPPGFWRAVARALVFSLAVLAVRAFSVADDNDTTAARAVWLLVLFSVARRKNGYVALHDRFTKTRVVRRRARAEARDRTERAAAGVDTSFEGSERVGPYQVPLTAPREVSSPRRIVAFDDRLNRRVWIDLLPQETPPLPAWRRDLDRPARLRWLAGRRDGGECWDAYEAVDGAPFTSLAGTPQPWSRVRHWLSDLTREIAAAVEDGSLPALIPERVWIGTDGHARILERPAPDHPDGADAAPDGIAAAQKFLYTLAVAALTGTAFDRASAKAPETPLPLRARAFVLSLRDAKFASPAALRHALEDLAEVPATVGKSSRGLQLAASAAMPIGVAIAAVIGVLFLGAQRRTESVIRLDQLLDEIEDTEEALAGRADPAGQRKIDDIEIYLAEHMAPMIEDPATWEGKGVKIGDREARERARAALERRKTRTTDEIRRAEATVAPILARQDRMLGKLSNARGLLALFTATLGGTYVAVAFFAFAGALFTGSGFTFRLFGSALVNRRGQPISRVRGLWRAAITWSPIAAVAVAFKIGPDIMNAGLGVIAMHLALIGIVIAGAIWAWTHPSRGIQDRLAGTWLVPR